MIDFGEWADEENSIAGAEDMSDSDGWSEDQYWALGDQIPIREVDTKVSAFFIDGTPITWM